MISRTADSSIDELNRQVTTHRLHISTVGWALSTFLSLSYLLCVAGYLAFPRPARRDRLLRSVPVTPLSGHSFELCFGDSLLLRVIP